MTETRPSGPVRSSPDRQVGVTDPALTSQRPEGPTQPFQFTLRQLLGAMAIICVAGASIYWLGAGLGIFAIISTSFFSVAIFFLFSHKEFGVSLVLGVIITSLILALFPAPSATRASCQNNMRIIALALQNYHDEYNSFPPAYIADADGNPIHSWRVLLLPFIEQEQLHNRYRFDEPWDGPNNSQLHSIVLPIYRCPSNSTWGPTTSYFAVTGSETIWPGVKSSARTHIGDGPTNTIMLVEYHTTGIHWMEPSDVEISRLANSSSSSTMHGITSAHQHNGTSFGNMAFADGHVQTVPNTTPAKSLRAALTISGGEKERLPIIGLPR